MSDCELDRATVLAEANKEYSSGVVDRKYTEYKHFGKIAILYRDAHLFESFVCEVSEYNQSHRYYVSDDTWVTILNDTIRYENYIIGYLYSPEEVAV